MRLKNKITAALKCKSGASLLFVLGVMFLLMAIGASVMAAASANIGSNIRQDKYNRAVVLIDSIHKNIKHSLQIPDTNTTEFENSLAYIIPYAIYNSSLTPDPLNPNPLIGEPFTEIQLDIDIAGVTDIASLQSVTLGFPFQEVSTVGPVGYIPETTPPTPRVPRTASISARMIVVVTVEIPATGFGAENRTITTHATYTYSGGVFSDENDLLANSDAHREDSTFIGEMEFAEPGEWKLISYEIVES